MVLIDRYGRPVTNMRISVTRRCNLRCFYCHREGEPEGPGAEMTPGEIARIVEVAVSLGIHKFKITGGEPLLRRDICDIVSRVSEVKGVREVSMSTNGTLLAGKAYELAESGLSRVNVSLDTLSPERYRAITGVDAHERVVAGIEAAVDAGLSPVKVNMVLLKGVNDDEVWDMVRFCGQRGVILQLIELVPPPGCPLEVFNRYHLDPKPIEDELSARALRVVVRRMHHRRKYLLEGGVEVEVVRPFHNTEFCAHCTRIRLTSDGKLKPCLMRNDNLVDLLGPLRRGASLKELEALFRLAVSLREPYYKG